MNKKVYMLMILLLAGLMPAKAEGIEFFHGSFEEALATAKAENKLVFMDAYAVWCGPCKWMSRNVFTDDYVGEFFNKNFIALKMDMEKGEGLALARKYGVRAYPTLYFLDETGKVVDQKVGATDSKGLLSLARNAMRRAPRDPKPERVSTRSGNQAHELANPGSATPRMVEPQNGQLERAPAGDDKHRGPAPLDAPRLMDGPSPVYESEEVKPMGSHLPDAAPPVFNIEGMEEALIKAVDSGDAERFQELNDILLDSNHPDKDLVHEHYQMAWEDRE